MTCDLCTHEAAHSVVALALGFEVTAVEVSDFAAGRYWRGKTWVVSPPPEDAARLCYRIMWAAVGLAGHIAAPASGYSAADAEHVGGCRLVTADVHRADAIARRVLARNPHPVRALAVHLYRVGGMVRGPAVTDLIDPYILRGY